jgi:transposase-like protein
MKKPQLNTPEPNASSTWEHLEDFVREYVQQFIQALLEEDVTKLLGRTKSARQEAVDAEPGYRNDYGKPRRLTLTSGTITVRRPRVRDLNERFVSRVLPLFKRQTKEVGELLPQLYLHGLALGDFELALRGLLGDGAPLSTASQLRLKTQWQGEYESWKQRRLDDLEVVYIWADGLYVKAGLEDTKAALLVMIGVLTNGQKVVLAVESGQRESKESWRMMLRDLRKRGLKPWRCTIADGHLGLWAALGEQYPTLAEQRCWNHPIVNVLDAMPKKHQAEARTLLCTLPYAETQAACETLRAEFTTRYQKLAPKAVERLGQALAALYAGDGRRVDHSRMDHAGGVAVSRTALATA